MSIHGLRTMHRERMTPTEDGIARRVNVRVLEFTCYEPRRRFLRLGYWCRWQIEVVTTLPGQSLEWHHELVSGWIRGKESHRYLQVRLGEETEISHRMETMAHTWFHPIDSASETA